MVGPKCHVLVRTVVIFRFVIFNSSYTTGFSFILVPTWLLISVSVYNTFDFLPCRARQFTNISAAPVGATVSIDACQTFIPLINALGSMNVGLIQICTPLSPSSSHNKNQIHVHNHARVLIDCERVSDHWAFPSIFSSTLILIPTQLILALFPNQENTHTRVCRHGELLRTAHVSSF